MSNIGQSNTQDTRKTPPTYRPQEQAGQQYAHNTNPIRATPASQYPLLLQLATVAEQRLAEETQTNTPQVAPLAVSSPRQAVAKYKNSPKEKASRKKYENSPQGKATRKRRNEKWNEKMKKQKNNQPIIPVSDKTILSTNTPLHKTKTHTATVQYRDKIKKAYSAYSASGTGEKRPYIHGLIKTIEGMGLVFLSNPTLNQNTKIYEGRKLSVAEQSAKIRMYFNAKDRKISRTKSMNEQASHIETASAKTAPTKTIQESSSYESFVPNDTGYASDASGKQPSK